MVKQKQMALASLMDSAVSDSFGQSSVPSSQTALSTLWASMDDLVARSSSRPLLAFSQSSGTSVGWVTLLHLGVAAMGEMVVGTSSRDVSAISTSSRVLTWDEVSTSLGSSFSLWGGGVSMTTGFGIFGVKSPDQWPDASNIAQDRRLLTSMVMLTCLSDFGGVVLRGLVIIIVEHLPIGNAFWCGSSALDCRMSISRNMDLPPVRLMS